MITYLLQNQNTFALIIEIIMGLIIVCGLVYIIKKKSEGKKKATEYLSDISQEIIKITVNTALECAKNMKSESFNGVKDFEDYVLEKAMSEIWKYIDYTVDNAVSDGIISPYVRSLFTIEFVDKYVQELITKMGVNSNIRGIYCENIVSDSSTKMIQEDERLLQQFSSEDYFEDEEEVDNLQPGDLEADDTDVEYKLVAGNLEKVEEKEIIPPQDEVDITEDSRVTEIIEDGLTEEEKSQGIKINKSGRKVDAKGRYVKTKK